MTTPHSPCRRFAALSPAAALVLAASVVAQQPPPPPKPNPAAPTLNPVVPLGMQRGSSLELTLTGTNLANPVAFWTSIPGARATIPTDASNGKDSAKLRVKLDVPREAPLGFYPVRLATDRGMSNLRLFCIDDLPQVLETDSNRSRAAAQAVPVPCVVVGRADAEITDYFKITVKAGQRVSIEVLGHRLGSAFDPQVSVVDPRNGRELAYSNDSPGQQTDPRLTYTFKDAGDYLIEVRDVTYRGGADFHYRLRIGDFPCATTPVPMAARRGNRLPVVFAGPAVEDVPPVEVAVPDDPLVRTVWVTPRGPSGLPGWPVPLAVSAWDEFVEQEGNNEPERANRLPIPCGVTGRFLGKGDIDHFIFALRKGQRYIIEARTQEMGSPTEVYLVLKDSKGAQVGASNPQAAARIDYTAAADDDFTLTVEHLHYWGGPTETYHLSIALYQPSFDLTVALDRWDVPQEGTVNIPILAARRDYTGPIEVSVAGHPGVTGTLTIKAGQPAAPNQPAGQLSISARPDVPIGPHMLTLLGKATINGLPYQTTASVAGVVKAELGNLTYPPQDLQDQLALAVTEKPPFRLAARLDLPEAARGLPATLTVTATRAPGFTEEIALSPGTLPANVTAALKPIPKGANEVKVQLTAAANAALGSFPISVVGKTKYNNKEFAVTSVPASVVVALPFTLKVEPLPVKLLPGNKAKIKVTAERKGGYQGPIAVEVRNLPANVTAPKGTIAMGQASVEVELTAAAGAAAGDKADVNVLGTATGAGNQTNPSANFTVSLGKK